MDKDIYIKAHKLWGDAQFVVLMEECAELQKEASKAFRGNVNFEGFSEEIADVEIMIGQMKAIFDANSDGWFSEHVEVWKEKKLRRLAERIKKATQ